MKKLILISLLLISSACTSDEYAYIASTNGYGEIEISKNYLIITTSKRYKAVFPKVVKEGTSINIRVNMDGKNVDMKFPVAEISTKGDLCRFHSIKATQYSNTIGNVIYVKPCRYK
ncbi:hypothetical protein ACTMBL_001039 [Vibrio cholerae]